MNHFWKFWMDFKIFPEVLLSFLSNLFKKDLVDWKQHVQTGYQGDLKKKISASEIHSIISKIVVKTKKINSWFVLTLLLHHYNGVKNIYLWQLFLKIIYLFDFFSLGILWIGKMNYFDEGICFPCNSFMEIGKRHW